MASKVEQALGRFYVVETISASIASLAFAFCLIFSNALALGTLIAGAGTGAALIFMIGSVTSLTPTLIAISIHCCRERPDS